MKSHMRRIAALFCLVNPSGGGSEGSEDGIPGNPKWWRRWATEIAGPPERLLNSVASKNATVAEIAVVMAFREVLGLY